MVRGAPELANVKTLTDPAGSTSPPVVRGEVRSSFRRWAKALAVLPMALVLLHLLVETDVPWYLRAIGAIPGSLAVRFGARYLREGVAARLPFIEYALLQAYVSWGLPTITGAVTGTVARSDGVELALYAMVLSVFVMLVGYRAGLRTARAAGVLVRAWLPPGAKVDVGIAIYPWIALVIVVSAGGVAQLPEEYRYIGTVLGSCQPVLAYLAVQAVDRPKRRGVLIAVTALIAIAGLSTGMMEAALRPVLVYGFLDLVLFKRISTRMVVLFAAAAIAITPVKLVYRQLTWTEPGQRYAMSVGMFVSNWAAAFEEAWGAGGSLPINHVDALASRLSELPVVAVTFDRVPDVIPYEKGEQWAQLIWAPLPRALVPEKPNYTEIFNNRFSVEFGFQTREGTRTSTMCFPLLADGYWNFGWFGVIFVSLFVGGLLALFSHAIPVDRWAGVALAVTFIADLHVNDSFGAQLLGVFQRLVGVAILCWAIYAIARVRNAIRR